MAPGTQEQEVGPVNPRLQEASEWGPGGRQVELPAWVGGSLGRGPVPWARGQGPGQEGSVRFSPHRLLLTSEPGGMDLLVR